MQRWALLVALVVAPLVGVWADEKAQDAKGKGVKGGREAPAFTLKDTKDKEHSLDKYKDKIIVLEWTEPGCPYIVNHAKAGTMKKIAEDYAEKGVVFFGVCTSRNTDTAGMSSFMTEYGIDYKVLMDPTGATGKAYGASNTPHMFIIKDGQIVYEGAIDDDPRMRNKDGATNYVRKALDELLADQPVSSAKTKPYG